jgi:hypothetical protein
MTTDNDDFDSLYGSKYLSVPELKGQQPRRKIGKVDVETLKEKDGSTKRKYVVFFDGEDKGLVCNKTNATKLAEAFGKKFADWPGNFVELYSEMTSLGKPGVRVRPLRKPATLAQPDRELDDAIPF